MLRISHDNLRMQKAPRSRAAAAAAAALYFSTQPGAERDESRPCVSLPRWPNAALRPVSCDSADGDLKKKRAAVLKPLTLSHISLQTQLHFAKSLTNGGLTHALLTGLAGDQVGFIAVEFMSEWSRCMLISPSPSPSFFHAASPRLPPLAPLYLLVFAIFF